MPILLSFDGVLFAYPELRAFLTSSPPDLTHIEEIRSKEYQIDFFRKYTALEFCAYFGKTAHLQSLPIEDYRMEIQKNDYRLIQLAIMNGHTETVKYLMAYLTDEEKIVAFKSGDYYAFTRAAENNYLGTIKYLKNYLTDEEMKKAIQASNYCAIRFAAVHNNKETVTYLKDYLTAKEMKEAIQADKYFIIRMAAENNHLEMIKYLETYLTAAEIKEAVKAEDYYALRWAATNGHLTMIKYLETYLSVEERVAAVQEGDYDAIKWPALHNYQHIINHFLHVDVAMAYAEAHDREYAIKYVYPYIEQKILMLKQAKSEFEKQNLLDDYNLNDEEARHAFYMARNLIRRNDLTLNDDLIFLLSIPSVKALAAKSVNEGPVNELLSLAQSQDNQAAENILLAIPAVYEQAERDDYYRMEMRDSIYLDQMSKFVLDEAQENSNVHALSHLLSTEELSISPHVQLSLFQPVENNSQQVMHSFTVTPERLE